MPDRREQHRWYCSVGWLRRRRHQLHIEPLIQCQRLEAALREAGPGTDEYPKLMRLHRQTAMLAAFLATKLRLVPSAKTDKKAPTDGDAPLVA